LPGTDACLPRAEAEEFERDLNKHGLAIVKPGDDQTGAAAVYLPDARNYVLVRTL
jgi:hypothetical protein